MPKTKTIDIIIKGLESGKLQEAMQGWSSADNQMANMDIPLNERLALFNKNTGFVTNSYLYDAQEEIGKDLIMSAVEAAKGQADSMIHTHGAYNIAALSPEDVSLAITALNDGITKQYVMGLKEVSFLDLSSIPKDKLLEIEKEFNAKFEAIQNEALQSLEAVGANNPLASTALSMSDEFQNKVKNALTNVLKNVGLNPEDIYKTMSISEFTDSLKSEKIPDLDIKVKAKLSPDFISDIQSQIDNMGVEPTINVEAKIVPNKKTEETSRELEKTFSNDETPVSTDAQQQTEVLKQEEEQAKATAEAEKELKQERQQSVSESESATQGAASVKNEADELDNLILKAQQAANAKKEFVEANKQLMESVINSLKGLNLEGQGFEELNKLINNIGNNKDGRIDSIIEKLEKIKELFMSNVADDSFIHELDSISSHEQGLSDLLKILKDYKDNLSDVAKAENEVNESTTSSSTDSSTIKILDNDTKKTIEDVQKLKDELKDTSDIYETIKIGKDKDGNSVTHTSYQHKNKDYTANVNEAGDVTSVTTKVSSGYTDQLNNVKKIQGAYSELIRLQRQLDSLARQKDSPARQQAVKDTNAQISATKELIKELNKESYTDEQLLEIKKSRQKYELQLSQLRSKVASDNVSNREKKELQQSKEMYDQLKQAVKDYVAVKKQNAAKAGKDELLQEDIDKADKLQERIDSIKEKIKNNGLFNGKLEGKATSGLNGLDTTLTEIENSARDSRTLKQQKANVDELKRSYDRLYLLEKKLDELQKNPMTDENKNAIKNVEKLISNEETLIDKLQKETYTKEQQTQIDKIRENYNTKQKNDLAELATKETELAEATEKRKQAENGEALRNLYKQQESEMDSLIDKQKTVGESFMAEQEAYEQNFIKQKQGYEELKALVQSYVTVMKQNARNGAMGKLLQKDIDYADELEERIYGLTDKLAGDKSLFNADLESKALSGLTGLDTTLERISRTTNDTQYIKQQQKDANELIKLYDKLYNAEQKIRESELITDNPAKQDKIFRDNQILVESYQKRKAVLEETSYTERQLSDIETAKQDYYLKTTKAMLAVDMAKKRLNNTTTEEIQKDKEVELAEQKKSEALERTRLSLINQLNTLTRNGKLMRVYGTEVNKMISELQNTDVAENRLKSIRNRLTEIKVEANKTGNSGATLIQMISGRFKSLLAYLSTFASFYRVVSYVRQAFTTIKDLDTQLVDLRKTTSMNTQELNNFYHASSDVAKQLGVTTSEIISQASAWSRFNKIDPLYGNI